MKKFELFEERSIYWASPINACMMSESIAKCLGSLFDRFATDRLKTHIQSQKVFIEVI